MIMSQSYLIFDLIVYVREQVFTSWIHKIFEWELSYSWVNYSFLILIKISEKSVTKYTFKIFFKKVYIRVYLPRKYSLVF